MLSLKWKIFSTVDVAEDKEPYIRTVLNMRKLVYLM